MSSIRKMTCKSEPALLSTLFTKQIRVLTLALCSWCIESLLVWLLPTFVCQVLNVYRSCLMVAMANPPMLVSMLLELAFF